MLMKFIQKYGKEGLDLIAKHPGAAAGIGAAGVAGAGTLGALGGEKATVHAIPGRILDSLGLGKDTQRDARSAYDDALTYAKKHPVAGGMIGAASAKGVDPYLQKIIAMMGMQDGQQQA